MHLTDCKQREIPLAHISHSVSACAQIVLTIHQPSSDICERFDDLILLSCGRMLYCGPWGDADAYFASAGFE